MFVQIGYNEALWLKTITDGPGKLIGSLHAYDATPGALSFPWAGLSRGCHVCV